MEKRLNADNEANVHKVVKEEMDAALRPLYIILERQSGVMDKIADGAQAQMLSANILHGNEALGLKGFVPETRERLAHMETWAENKDRVDDERWDETVKRVSALERNQNRFSRGCKKVLLMLLKKDEEGKRDVAKISIVAALGGTLVTWVGSKLYDLALYAWKHGGHLK